MVDVGRKPTTSRTATARGRLFLQRATLALLESGDHPRGMPSPPRTWPA